MKSIEMHPIIYVLLILIIFIGGLFTGAEHLKNEKHELKITISKLKTELSKSCSKINYLEGLVDGYKDKIRELQEKINE